MSSLSGIGFAHIRGQLKSRKHVEHPADRHGRLAVLKAHQLLPGDGRSISDFLLSESEPFSAVAN